MELTEAIKTRRSIRVFSDRKLEKDVLEKVIEAGKTYDFHIQSVTKQEHRMALGFGAAPKKQAKAQEEKKEEKAEEQK